MIPRSTRLAEAPSFGKPIIHYDHSCSAAAAYELLSQEVLARLEKPLEQPQPAPAEATPAG
jgi:chromosome partitioning protein